MTPFNRFVIPTFIITYTPGDIPGCIIFSLCVIIQYHIVRWSWILFAISWIQFITFCTKCDMIVSCKINNHTIILTIYDNGFVVIMICSFIGFIILFWCTIYLRLLMRDIISPICYSILKIKHFIMVLLILNRFVFHNITSMFTLTELIQLDHFFGWFLFEFVNRWFCWFMFLINWFNLFHIITSLEIHYIIFDIFHCIIT